MRISVVPLLCTVALCATAAGEEIMLTVAEIENLGIRSEPPVAERRLAAIGATATVVVPPSGDIIVTTPLAGMASRLLAAAGESVAAGQVLAEVRSPEFIELQRDFLNSLNQKRLAATELARDEQLFAEGIISERRVQESGVREKIAATAYREHRQLLAIAGLLPAEIDALELDQQLLESMRIRAPIAGVVIEQLAMAGARLDGVSPVYRVADLSTLWLAINMRQEDIRAVRPGMRVSVPSAEAAGEVIAVGRAVDPVTQTGVVRAELDTAAGLSPGQFVQVQVMADDPTETVGAWSVPAAAVTQAGGIDFVFVRSAQGFVATEVRVLGTDGGRARIRAPLAADDRVVVAGVAVLKSILAGQEGPDS